MPVSNILKSAADTCPFCHQFDEKTLRLSLADIAKRSYGGGNTVNRAPEEGWTQDVAQAMTEVIITPAQGGAHPHLPGQTRPR